MTGRAEYFEDERLKSMRAKPYPVRQVFSRPVATQPASASRQESLFKDEGVTVLQSKPLIEAWFDGAIAPKNPGGHASYGVVIKIGGVIACNLDAYVGHGDGMSNNVAEACGVIRVLEELPGFLELNPGATAVVYGDSQIVINALKNRSAGGLFAPYVAKAQALYFPLRDRVRLQWIPREENGAADALSRRPLLVRGIIIERREELIEWRP